MEYFDYKFYIDFYKDIQDIGISNYDDAFNHWNNHGKMEGRFCNKFMITEYDEFDWNFYIENCNINQLNIREKYWISKNLENSYNLAEGGTGGWTTKYYDELTLKKFKEKLSISLKGRIVSKSTREKLSKINKNRFYGNRETLSNSLKKVWEDPSSSYNSSEYRKKLSDSAKNRVWKDETKNKIRDGKIGSKNPMAIKIQVDTIIYETRRECAKAHNISETAVTKRCLSKNFNNWKIIK
jgi:hypothetical protein